MAASEAQKKAYEKYAQTEGGQLARKKAVEKYFSTEKGQQKRQEIQLKIEQAEERKAYKRKWMKQHRLRKKLESAQEPLS